LDFWKIKHQAFELETLNSWAWKVGLLEDKTPSVELRNWDFKRIENEFWALKMSSSFSHSFVFSPLRHPHLQFQTCPLPHVICHHLPAERAQKTRQKGSKRHQNYDIFLHK
jgi:hypothetical protein